MCQSGDGWRHGPSDQTAYQTKLSDAQYARLEPLLPPPGNHLKIPHRHVLDAWLYVYYQGCTWRGLPREFGNWHTIYVRLNRWAKAGVLERVVQALQQELLVESDADTLSLDSTIIHPHMHGTGARRTGGAPCSSQGQAGDRPLSGRPDDEAARAGRQRPPPADHQSLTWSASRCAMGSRIAAQSRSGQQPTLSRHGPRLRRRRDSTLSARTRLPTSRPAQVQLSPTAPIRP